MGAASVAKFGVSPAGTQCESQRRFNTAGYPDVMGVTDIFVIRPDGSSLERVAQNVGTPMPLDMDWLILRDAE